MRQSFAVLALLGSIKADQPVHCIKDKIYGTWDFHISNDVANVNLFETNEVCTHEKPNHVQIVNENHKFQFENQQVMRVSLNPGYQATSQVCSSQDKCDGQTMQGTWTTVYDQAMRVELENGSRFVTNFRYNIKPELSKDPLADGADKFIGTQTGDYQSFNSDCHNTMVGFVQTKGGKGTMKEHPIQCFSATQVQANKVNSASEIEASDGAKYAKIIPGGAHTLAEAADDSPMDEVNLMLGQQTYVDQQIYQRKSHKRYNAHRGHVPSEINDILIEAINNLDIGWKADTCKYQKHHSKYGDHCENPDHPLNLAQTSGEEPKQFGQGPEFAKALEEAQKFQKKYSNAAEIPDDALPENFDWRSVGGYDFTGDHRDQGHCGSCYTVSFTQIAENRLKIKYGQDMPMMSPQFLMTCNYMNEGCDGGWPHFHGYMAESGHLVTEECAPYKGSTKGDKCSNYAECPPVAKVTDSYWIGKGYGDSGEKKMMKEIIRNGAVNGELQCPKIFGMYTKGIMSSSGIQTLHDHVKQTLAQTSSFSSEEAEKNDESKGNLTDKNLEDYGLEWQNLNHSVTIIGWGTDEQTKQKYWIVRNSYGSKWGDGGEFMVQRGTDDFGIESETTGYMFQLYN